MEIGQIQCDNLGMTKDTAISALSQSKDGTTNYAFENFNIRVMPVNDNTKFSVTNEKSTIECYDSNISAIELTGVFMGGCKLNKYLVVFTHDTAVNAQYPDYIYRIEYTHNTSGNHPVFNVITLYNGKLGFSTSSPIEALGYYESEEIQKVYWVDGLNKNRFINIVADLEVKYIIGLSSYKYDNDSSKNKTLDDPVTLHALTTNNGTVDYYVQGSLVVGNAVFKASDVDAYFATAGSHTLAGLTASYTSPCNLAGIQNQYNDYSFDFQGHIDYIPQVTVEKNYEKAGTFQAGTLQYFMTYYNKYGVETCIIWNSDLQYISLSDRGAKADEAVSCGFDFTITNIDTDYDYLRIYSCYRSGINGVVSSNIVTDISLEGKNNDDVIYFTDLGVTLEGVNAQDMPYIGGQNIIANTLDYKQDTMFLGDIKLPETNSLDMSFKMTETEISDLKDSDGNAVKIQNADAISWVYKRVSKDIPSGVYSYTSELRDSQEEISGFKWREVYRFGIQFMDATGQWTSAYWIGDKYNDCRPIRTNEDQMIQDITAGTIFTQLGVFRYDTYLSGEYNPYRWIDTTGTIYVYTRSSDPAVNTYVYQTSSEQYISYKKIEAKDVTGHFQLVPDAYGITRVSNFQGQSSWTIDLLFSGEGDYIAQAYVNFSNLFTQNSDKVYIEQNYLAYRLLFADMDVTSRRIVEQGVICPTMFNYYDRYYNRPYSIPSWMFRPRTKLWDTKAPINRHYDTFSESKIINSELQGIVKKRVPGYDPQAEAKTYNAYCLIIASNDGGSYMKWKLIYFNAGQSDQDKIDAINIINDVNTSATGVYSTYKVVSSGTLKKACGKWDEVHGEFISKITSDTQQAGEDVILSPAMLPTAEMLKEIAYAKGDSSYIWLILGVIVLALGAAVASVFTAGAAAVAGFAAISALTASATTAASAALLSVSTSVLSSMAIAGAAGSAALASSLDNLQEIDKRMGSLNFLPVESNHALEYRQKTPKSINNILSRLFKAADSDGIVRNLTGDSDQPFTNNYSTEEGALGADYNAYYLGGPTTYLSGKELDLKEKQNLFCVDESIVTLNAPDVEDNYHTIENSEAFDLELVGMIPVESVRGEYDLKVSAGLNNSAEVLQNRFVNNELPSADILGLVQGNLYQDTWITEDAIKDAWGETTRTSIPRMMVSATTGLYKQWLWNRETSVGLWLPGMTLLDPILTTDDEEVPISTPGAIPQRKLFSNLRYSPYTAYYKPFTMDIESPAVCLDAQTMLKKFIFNGQSKFYYENVNTISVNNENYYLMVGNQVYPQNITVTQGEVSLIEYASLQDPVSIKYRTTPHILLPLKTDENGVFNILPYTDWEDKLYPRNMYLEKSDESVQPLENIQLDGTEKTVPTTTYISVPSDLSDLWESEGIGFTYESGKYKSTTTTISGWKILILLETLNSNFHSQITSIITQTGLTREQIYDNSVHLKYSLLSASVIKASLHRFTGNKLILRLGGSSNIQNFQMLISTTETLTGFEFECTALTYTRDIKIGETTETNVNAAQFVAGDGVSFYTKTNHNVTATATQSAETSAWTVTFNADATTEEYSIISTALDEKLYFYDTTTNPQVYIRTSESPSVWRVQRMISNYQGTTWNQVKLDGSITGSVDWGKTTQVPYLFMGELVKKIFDYNTWLGGTEEYGLERLTWNVASKVTPITDTRIKYTWGDTFYQRWDCQKTYPYTEEDKNSISDILSFMVETHKNLDGRCDINRGIDNLLNVRPRNTQYNDVYSQKDNFFSYQTLDEKFNKTHFEADVVWSLTKNNNDDIDKWTSLVASNEMSLDGRFGTVRKILNLNDTLIAFQDQALSMIKYNEQAALATTSGLPLQMGNTGKVEGYRLISDTTGCHNKFSISKNSAGVFYIDDYNKAFNTFSTNGGAANIGLKAEFSSWFKHNITGSIWSPDTPDGFRASYDEITSDLYLSNNDTCLIYNTLLGRFTSFMSYVNTPIITEMFNDKGQSNSFALYNTTNSAGKHLVSMHQLFGGTDYGSIYGTRQDYYIEYRLNPDPRHDSIFTNYSYMADWLDPAKIVDEENVFGIHSQGTQDAALSRRFTTFDEVKAYNEYQIGEMDIKPQRMGIANVKAKFRIWRGDIPRDGYTLSKTTQNFRGDRMRNPWIHLRFTKRGATNDDSKMVFHNLTVIYYNQYGRF